MRRIPNLFPTESYNKRIALIGESPGLDENNTGVPFIGKSGEFLMQALDNSGIKREQVFLGNVCQYMPPGNKIKAWSARHANILEGIEQLQNDLEEFNPDVVVCLGNTALGAFLPWEKVVTRGGRPREVLFNPLDDESWDSVDFNSSVKTSILAKWTGQPNVESLRGTFFNGSLGGRIYRCFATRHPAALAYDFQQKWLFYMDCKKLFKRIDEPLPVFEHDEFYAEFDSIVAKLDRILEEKPPRLGFDIEGTPLSCITCLSFAPGTRHAVFVGFVDIVDGNQIYTKEQQVILWERISRICYDDSIMKVMHNAGYEMFTLAYLHQIYIRNIEDTMHKQWCLLSDMPRNLGFLSSMHTNVPYYKEERTVPNLKTHAEYNSKDSCVTLECLDGINESFCQLPQKAQDQYWLFMENLPGVVNMQLEGFYIVLKELEKQQSKALQNKERIERVICTYFSLESFNINSTARGGDRQKLLYGTMKLDPVKNRQTGSVKADKDALYDIARRERKSRKTFQVCRMLIKCAEESKMASTMNFEIEGSDLGPVARSSFVAPGTETGRWNSKISYLGSGRNLPNVSKKEKRYIKGPPGTLLIQWDLSGADAWTVACHCASMGDSQMLNELRAGIKPAKLIRYMIDHGSESLIGKSLEELTALSKAAPDDGLYVGCKAYLYSSFYLGGLMKALTEIFKKSHGKVSLEMKELRLIADLIHKRYYGIKMWQDKQKSSLWRSLPQLQCASGQLRTILKDPRDEETLRMLLSTEPQSNTTHWINLALNRFLYDPINRDEDDYMIIMPIASVHDSLIMYFKETWLDRLSEIGNIVRTCFDNPIEIAGIPIICPAEGGAGYTWGDANKAMFKL